MKLSLLYSDNMTAMFYVYSIVYSAQLLDLFSVFQPLCLLEETALSFICCSQVNFVLYAVCCLIDFLSESFLFSISKTEMTVKAWSALSR